MHSIEKQGMFLCSKLILRGQNNSSEVAWDIIQTLANMLTNFKRGTLCLDLITELQYLCDKYWNQTNWPQNKSLILQGLGDYW